MNRCGLRIYQKRMKNLRLLRDKVGESNTSRYHVYGSDEFMTGYDRSKSNAINVKRMVDRVR